MNGRLESALMYAELGWPVIPLHTPVGIGCSCRRECRAIGKHPRTMDGLKGASTDPGQIEQWWKQWPEANIGIATGAASGLVGIDIDPRHGGDATLDVLAKAGMLPRTLSVRTGGGGRHLLYQHPGRRIACDATGKLGTGVDVRGDGGYLVAAPSVHVSGTLYAWEGSPSEIPADLPSWIEDRLAASRQTSHTPSNDDPVTEGARHGFLLAHAGRLRRQGLPPEAIDAALQVVNRERCSPPKSPEEVAKIARDIGAKPAGDPVRVAAPLPPDDPDDGPTPIQYSDDAIASAFSDRHRDDLRFVPEWGWLLWDGKRWSKTADVLVMDMARRVCRAVAAIAREDGAAGQESSRRKLAAKISSAATAAAVERLARGAPEHFSDAKRWDSDPWILNTPGGTVDLKTGRLREHRREDRCTKLAAATPRGHSPRWTQFLKRVVPDDIAAYLKRLAGYSLTGMTSEECFDFFYGQGGNGKGTFLNTLTAIMGDYAVVTSSQTFLETKHERHLTEIAKLAGARLVTAQEVDEGSRWNEVRLKELTGRDPVSARFMRKDEFTFLPQLTLIFAGNSRPTLKTTDEAIRRRFHLVPFEQNIPAAERDIGLKDALAAERDGIMAWAVEGAVEWQRLGLSPPASIMVATEEYLESEDTLGLWLADCCIVGTDHEEPGSLLYASFKRWKEARGEGVPSLTRFGRTLDDRGFKGRKARLANTRVGLRLNDLERRRATEAYNVPTSRYGGE